MDKELERVIDKNWVVGTIACLVLLLAGWYYTTVAVGVGTVLWNLFLHWVALIVKSPRH